MVIPTVAEEDCTIPVTTIPTSTHLMIPKKVSGLNRENQASTSGISFKGPKPLAINSRPKNTIPSPRSTVAVYRSRSRLANKKTSAERPSRGKPYWVRSSTSIQAVIVVPILAPSITPMACVKVISSALTIPTTITVVTELDWMTEVMMAPIPQATSRLLVTALISLRILFPATACIPSDMFFMPSKNIPSPPITPKTIFKMISNSIWFGSFWVRIPYRVGVSESFPSRSISPGVKSSRTGRSKGNIPSRIEIRRQRGSRRRQLRTASRTFWISA
ncbi:MAG: hypothetical protein BWY71_01857 [Planctomycetes bacterium ADurb.Bin412]|nr:MAG: hypothetical protein BWY71_01857 [Planctomycetes bacterium ADurb.Bin412]